MINQAEINKKAMQDIFAMDEAVGQFESFGSQLDLGLPPVEDDAPKSFEDMLDVNPSNEPTESGEYFMNEGDDLQDTATQKFVVDEFAKQLMKCDDTVSVKDRLPDIAAYIQGTNNIKGDVQSFLRDTIDRATAFQQAQNVSEALPNGVVDPNAQPAAPVDGVVADPTAEGIPTMAPIDPTAEPTLEPNAADEDPLGGLDDLGLGDLGAEEPATEEAPAEDGLEGLGDGLEGLDDSEPAAEEPAAEETASEDTASDETASDETASEDDDLSALLGEDEGSDESKESEGEDADDTEKAEDDDADFDFESIAKKAHGLVEGTNGQEEASAETDDSAVAAQGEEMGTTAAETELTEEGEGTEQTPTTECGEKAPTTECGENAPTTEDDVLAEKQAQIESIARQCRLRMTAEKAKKLVESYQQKRDRANKVARLESVISDLRKKAKTESIIDKFASESKARAKAITESVKTSDKPSKFDSLMAKARSVMVESAKKQHMKEAADKVIAEFEAQANLRKTVDAIVENAAASVGAAKAKMESADNIKEKLDTILEGVAKKAEVSKMEADLAKIVADVKNA